MTKRLDHLKQDAIGKVVGLARSRLPADRADGTETYIRLHYAQLGAEDLVSRDPEALYGAALSLWSFSQHRPPATPRVRVYTPTQEEHGWSTDHSVLECVNDDMPFLVDSVVQALQRREVAVHLVVHPILCVERGADGRVAALHQPGSRPEGAHLESWMHLEIDRQPDDESAAQLVEAVLAVLADVRAAVTDWQAMRSRMDAVAEGLDRIAGAVPADEAEEARAFLQWLHDDHFTFLGYRYFRLQPEVSIDGQGGLGLTRSPDIRVFDIDRDLADMPAEVLRFLRQPNLLLVTKADRMSTVHRSVPMDIVGVKDYGPDGQVVGLHAMVGLFTAAAYTASPAAVPLLRRKVAGAMARSGVRPDSHDGRALLTILETFPRDELFQIAEDMLLDTALGILRLQERQRVALFVRRDEFGRFLSCLVYVPRDRYDTALRQAMQAVLEDAFTARVSTYFTQVVDAPLARLHFILRVIDPAAPEPDLAQVEARLADAARSWSDHLRDALLDRHGEAVGLKLYRRYANAFPPGYQASQSAQAAVVDMDRIEQAGGALALNLYQPLEAADHQAAFKLYHPGTTVPLSDVLPVLENLGFRVISEVPHELARAGGPVRVHDFFMQTADGSPVDVRSLRDRFHDAFRAVWEGRAENDGFNRLVLLAGLTWREVVILRAYAKYMRQAGTTFSQAYLDQTLAANPGLTCALVQLFRARFDPQGDGDTGPAEQAIQAGLDQVVSADQDRILRFFRALMLATLRTNYYQPQADGSPKDYLSLKLDSRAVPGLPLPRPWVEVFVYSPRMEGIHLRGGKVARGGIRWSDRREDFRTEILGLMKAQMVKNSVIIPTGAKGGFVVKRPPAAREELQAEGIACYQTLIRGLLDITDNLKGGVLVPPLAVRRHDGDDPYLVVAADKGTATFSDIANAISLDYGHWLGDAFASGGSKGYDHKAMGITARGAWVSVQRHFREMGLDVQSQDFTVAGVGDMSGDVFGNGMLRSRHIRLVAAFDHRHIFLDPDPDPAASFAERERLFALPRSSWADYTLECLSPGGMVVPRTAKSVRVTPQVQALLDLADDTVTPDQLMQAILTASVDLLWFGGIGTYVKAAAESNDRAGDRANDAIRVDARQLRCKVVGEGANLAFTQLGRIEFALAGGRINTDAIDNSAGVDTSDHEVNIKILVDEVVAQGDLTDKQRNGLLASMTDDVAALVLRDNYLQTQAISLIESIAPDILDQQDRLMRLLEKEGRLARPVEFLPGDEALAERSAAKRGLTRPEIAVLLAYSKLWLNDHLGESDLPDHPLLVAELEHYFPDALAGYDFSRHRLRREIVATVTTNSIINRVGGTFVSQMMERSGQGPVDVARAYLVAREAYGLRGIWQQIEDLDHKVAAEVQYGMLREVNRLIERGVSWLLHHGPQPMDMGAMIAELTPGIADLQACLENVLPPDTHDAVQARLQAYVDRGVPEPLARQVAHEIVLASAFDIIRIGQKSGLSVPEAALLYFATGARFGLGWLRAAADRTAVGDHWQKLAAAALIEDLYARQRELTLAVAAAHTLEDWLTRRSSAVERFESLLAELKGATKVDLAALTVAAHQLRGLTEG